MYKHRPGDRQLCEGNVVGAAPASEYGRRLAAAARRAGKSPATMYRLIHRHGMPATFVSGTWFIKDEDLDRFFRERTAARLGKPAPIDNKSHDAADAALTEAGW